MSLSKIKPTHDYTSEFGESLAYAIPTFADIVENHKWSFIDPTALHTELKSRALDCARLHHGRDPPRSALFRGIIGLYFQLQELVETGGRTPATVKIPGHFDLELWPRVGNLYEPPTVLSATFITRRKLKIKLDSAALTVERTNMLPAFDARLYAVCIEVFPKDSDGKFFSTERDDGVAACFEHPIDDSDALENSGAEFIVKLDKSLIEMDFSSLLLRFSWVYAVDVAGSPREYVVSARAPETSDAIVRVEPNPRKRTRSTIESPWMHTRTVELTMEQLIKDDGQSPMLYVPVKHKERILRLYGGWTMLEFDEYFYLNKHIGGENSNCFNSMEDLMNLSKGDLRDQWSKVTYDKVLSDVFNLVQSAVRLLKHLGTTRAEKYVWYEPEDQATPQPTLSH